METAIEEEHEVIKMKIDLGHYLRQAFSEVANDLDMSEGQEEERDDEKLGETLECGTEDHLCAFPAGFDVDYPVHGFCVLGPCDHVCVSSPSDCESDDSKLYTA